MLNILLFYLTGCVQHFKSICMFYYLFILMLKKKNTCLLNRKEKKKKFMKEPYVHHTHFKLKFSMDPIH